MRRVIDVTSKMKSGNGQCPASAQVGQLAISPQSRRAPAKRTETELLLTCIHTDVPNRDRISERLREPVAWSDLLQAAELHGVTPLLCRALCTVPHLVPEEVWRTLKTYFHRNACANVLRVRELLRVLGCLEAENISVIPYKGPTLAAAVYGDISLREFSDLDLLVRPGDLPRVREVLFQLGYESEYRFGATEEAQYLRSACEYNFIHPQLRLMLEMHWQILPRQFSLQFDLHRLWPRCQTMWLESSSVLALSPEDLLLVLCSHAAKHVWSRLIWLADIASLVEISPHLDWELCFCEARRIGAYRILVISLLLAESVLEANIPRPVRKCIEEDRLAHRVASALGTRLLQMPKTDMSRMVSHMTLLFAREKWRDKARYAYRTLAATGKSPIPVTITV